MTDDQYKLYQQNQDLQWTCNACNVPFGFSESFFEPTIDNCTATEDNGTTTEENNCTATEENNCTTTEENNCTANEENNLMHSVYESFCAERRKSPSNFILSHININSLQHKIDELKPLLGEKFSGLLIYLRNKIKFFSQ